MSIKYNVSEKGKAGRRLLYQAMAARQWAEMKANRRFKRTKPEVKKEAYEPGTLGLSSVSEAIKKDYGVIENRRGRRLIARAVAKYTTLKSYYNGEGPVRVPHNIKPSKYARG